MTDRGIYGDPQGARGVLSALGAPAARQVAPHRSTAAPGPVYRGRCGNAAFSAVYTGRGKDRVLLHEASDGCPNEIAPGDEMSGTLAVSIAVRYYHRLGAWPAWFHVAIGEEAIPARYHAMAARVDEDAPTNPLRLCQACIDKYAAPPIVVLPRQYGPGANYGSMPGLCKPHGQKAGICSCPPDAYNAI